MNIMKYTVAYSLPISLFVALPLGGPWLLMPVLIAFGLLPVADPFFGHDQSDPEEGSSTWAYDLLVRAWVPTQILVFVAALMFIAALVSLAMSACGFPVIVFIIAFFLGEGFERSLSQTLVILNGSPGALLGHPIALVLLAMAVGLAIWLGRGGRGQPG